MTAEQKETLKHLNEVNDVTIYSVEDEEFATYGKVITGADFSEAIRYMVQYTDIPAEGNIYVPSDERMEQQAIGQYLKDVVYGGMPIQIGYCNGKNSKFTAFEYHKGSEINVACCDMMLSLGHLWDIKDNTYDTDKAQVFFVPEGTAVVMYETTLHYAPIKVTDEGFRGIVVLPRDTNTPLERAPETCNCGDANTVGVDPEKKLLYMKNKWLIAHPDTDEVKTNGAYPGVKGEDKVIKY
ncbi:MAG: DUF4867 family protein [Lachnospiraceae bacterium]|nr:DUF4867 family protein [Lachnospiraceae bacterium]